MWTYVIRLGDMFDAGGEVIATGYSGKPEARNNPAMQDRRDVGPIPEGMYRIGAMIPRTEEHGPYVLPLEMVEGESFGRDGFLIHGDSGEHPGAASHGCIILPRGARLAIARSTDRMLKVVADG
jgi:hypothetical protein